ncbi:unnamed protein product [Leptidea sinapis]|uniref:Uncharacterized protein n=1 Tax=Leptidea sinapis TaxID=189913 RepID=A0A5E4QFS6_9NEOP|nr:unnamed protein product [Leptidea sinapis]
MKILPALSRYRNREHLHLSDEGLDMAASARPPLNLDMAASPRPPARPQPTVEAGSERRQRRIDKITELENRILKPDVKE